MAMITVRNLPDEVHRALKLRAAKSGRSTEAEVRKILANAVKPAQRLLIGNALAEIGRQAQLSNEDFAALESVKNKTPAKPMNFE